MGDAFRINFLLATNNGLFDERFAEHNALVRPSSHTNDSLVDKQKFRGKPIVLDIPKGLIHDIPL
jgi:hypothetical protein